jgi:hypothetical protein
LNLLLIFFVLLSFSVPSFAETENELSLDPTENYISGYTAEYESLSSQEKQKIRDAEAQWYADRTYNVTVTAAYSLTSANSKTNNLQIETSYTSNDPKFIKEFGVSEVSSIQNIPTEFSQKSYYINEKSVSADKLKNETITISEEKQIVLAAADDPFEWWDYGYAYPPQMWKKEYIGYFGEYTKPEDPISLIWNETTAANARATLVSQAGWVNVPIPFEYPYGVYDQNGSWIQSQSAGSTLMRSDGGYHVRIFQLSDGSVIGGAHEDSTSPHAVVEFEDIEYLVGTYFSQAGWTVENNELYLANSGWFGDNVVYNNGYATVITDD